MTATTFLAVCAGILGLAVGWFVNVVAWRVPRKEAIVRLPSHCPTCGGTVRAKDNVPIVSWLVLRGRCRHCGGRISVRYPLIELATAVAFVACTIRFGATPVLGSFLVLAAGGIALSVTDLERRLLPIRIVYPTLVLALPPLLVAAAVHGSYVELERAAIGGASAAGLYFLIHFAYPRGMAFGDVRLAGLLGTYVGSLGLLQLFVANFLAFASSALFGLILIALRRAGLKTALPFGPFMVAGAFVAVLFGGRIVDAWMGR